MSSSPVARVLAPSLLKIFLVEDSAVIRVGLVAALQEMLPVEVVGVAEDVAQARDWLSGHAQGCDLMIIDIFLKHGSGLDVLALASTLQPDARRVVLTNYATVEIRKRCRALGADEVFDKSTELEELIDYCGRLAKRP